MRKNLLLLAGGIILAGMMIVTLPSCSKKLKVPTAEVHYVGTANKTITLNSVGFGKTIHKAVLNAEHNAFDKLLFYGIPGSQFPNGMVERPGDQVKAQNEVYFEKFYGAGGYRSFVTATQPISPGTKDKKSKQYRASVQITINYNSLRKDLEQNGIMHKFGL